MKNAKPGSDRPRLQSGLAGTPGDRGRLQRPRPDMEQPLSDPLGGTDLARGRHQIKLKELKASDEAPEDTPFILMGSLQFSEAALRTYGHPDLLKVAAAIRNRCPVKEVPA